MIATTPEAVRELSYPDFVAFLRQTNAPPGGAQTLLRWIGQSGISADSRILDLACTTGFSSRTASLLMGCAGHGIDLSPAAVEVAREKAAQAGLSDRLAYSVGDAAGLEFAAGSFTHILAGCNFGFIQERERALDEAARVLADGGNLCVAVFHYHTPPPRAMLDAVEEVIGFRPRPEWTREFWERFHSRRFTRVAGKCWRLEPLAEPVLREAIRGYVLEEQPFLAAQSREVQAACMERLTHTREVLNRHRRFQGYVVETWVRHD